MSYPGDSSLSQEIRDRIVETFLQTLDLAEAGKKVEALLGCDFMLQLDPLFEPARTLQERVRSTDGEVATEDLRGEVDLHAEDPTASESEETDSAEPDEDFAEDEDAVRSTEPLSPSQIEADETEPSFGLPQGPHVSSSEQLRVQSFLDEGQAALEEGSPQKAIDTWSRIFLIDSENEEATKRIEEAQLLKAELERKLEELFAEAETLLEEDERDQALAVLEKVVEAAPDHLAALQRIDELTKEDSSPLAAPPDEEQRADLEGDTEPAPIPPIPSAPPYGEALTATPAPARETMLSSNLRFILIGSLVLLLLVALGAWLLSNKSRLFPNADSEPEIARLPDRITRVTGLHARGEVDQAIEALEKVQPDEPDYERAQLLLAEWKEPKTDDGEAGDDTAPDESRLENRRKTLEQAREAYAVEEYLSAARLFTRASAVAPLEGAEADLFEDAKRQLEPIAQMIDLYTQREYKLALPSMWRYFEENPEDRDVRRLLVNSHYNLAVRNLRSGKPEEAEALLEEAIELDLGDANAHRLLLFAQTYSRISRDLLYDIFVDNLEPRP